MTKTSAEAVTGILRNADTEAQKKTACRRKLTRSLSETITSLIESSKNLKQPIILIDIDLDNPLNNANFKKMLDALSTGTSSPRKISYVNHRFATTEMHDYTSESSQSSNVECIPTITKDIKDILYTQQDLNELNNNNEPEWRVVWAKHPKFNVILALEYIRHQLIQQRDQYLFSDGMQEDLNTITYLTNIYPVYTSDLNHDLAAILKEIEDARNINLPQPAVAAIVEYTSIARTAHSSESEPACWGMFQFSACKANDARLNTAVRNSARRATQRENQQENGLNCSIM